MKSPSELSSSSPIGVSREIGSLEILNTMGSEVDQLKLLIINRNTIEHEPIIDEIERLIGNFENAD